MMSVGGDGAFRNERNY